MAVIKRIATCRLCGGRDLPLAFALKPTPIADAYLRAERLSEPQPLYPLDLALCQGCGHLQLLDTIDPELLFGSYTYYTASSPGLVEHFHRQSEAVLRRVPSVPDALAVEIGSNDGSLLRFFKEAGLRVLGIDPAREIARRATEAGVETIAAFFTSELARRLRRERGPALIVAANNVFAHSDALGDMADGVRELLAPDGLFVFEVSYLADILEKMLFDTIYHEHLCYHAVRPLQSFFIKHGLELVDVERIPSKGGSIRGFVQKAGGPRRPTAAVSELIALESRLGLESLETYRAYAEKIERAKARLLGIVRDFKAQGKTIAGYGASHTVTTLLHHFELGGTIDFLMDDNPAKQGTYSPGYRIPVVSSQALYEKRPGAVVVLAWNFLPMIRQKHQAYLDQGGQFVVPLPELSVVDAATSHS